MNICKFAYSAQKEHPLERPSYMTDAPILMQYRQEQPQSTGGNGNLHKNAGNPVFGPSARRAAVRTPPDTLDSDLSVAEICYPWALMW